MKGRRRTVVAPEEGVIFTVSYIQKTIALPNGTGVVRLLFISICKQRLDIIEAFANIGLSTAAS